MIVKFLSLTEGFITFLFLMITLIKMYGCEKTFKSRYIVGLLWSLLFFLVFEPFEIRYGNFYLYLSFMLVFASIFSILFQKGFLANRIVFIIIYIYTIASIKSTLATIIGVQLLYSGYNSYTIAIHYIIFYSLIFFASIFFIMHPLHFTNQIPKRHWMLMAQCPIFVAVITQYCSSLVLGANILRQVFLILSCFILCIILSTYYLTYFMTKTYVQMINTNNINHRLQMQLEYMKRSSSIIKNIRKEKHEIKNNYFYIQSLVKNRKYEQLEHYLDTELAYRFNAMEEFQTGNKLFDFLLTQKVSEAREHKINVMTNVLLPSDLPIKDDDICALLLNLVDNAIDASKNEEQGDIHISISVIKNYLQIQIKNKSSIDVLKINKQLKTTKKNKENHGLGLQIIRSIVHKYNGIFKTSMKSNYFVVLVMLQLQNQ
ncbi:sensor histidine kinase [Clostridium fungisolvens]|uniref:Sensor histidine kinase NatK-like C-terminal domain-containing protein n=1 Tax=Clostridium fungisolvens TaxID=1604897 RepID=A0A6V8SH47_9CLOT|nr:sensor histidine kinase [Clostridium fungisolvens]GFP76529.1 hypothetical protein bsdtw1_02632 [Clostridium fungisolvens]